MNRRQLLDNMGIHDQPRCGAPYETWSERGGLVTITCHKPLGHPVDEEVLGHSGGGDGISASWAPDHTQSSCAIAYRAGLADA